MIHVNDLLLADTDGAPDGLLHERTRPPRTTEDHAIKVLEVQAHAARLELDEKDIRRLRGLVRGGNDLLTLSRTERPIVHMDLTNIGKRLQCLLEEFHL